ncbi:MAG TPA: hypothetical protein VMI75_00130 [Polyangiaceae bacterium]|nr:hypothetical protein [Polyangiaceae bacterium]
MRRGSVLCLLFALSVSPLALQACGGASSNGLAGNGDGGASSSSGGGSGGGSSGGSSGSSSGTSGGSSGGSSGGASSGGHDASTDGSGCTTSIHGTVWDPAKAHPIYNAIVYVPSDSLGTIAQGPSCDLCGSPPSGKPVAITLSKPDGTFELQGVPAGANVPIVVQVGKWRRENARIPTVTACGDTAVDGELTRLPKNKSEGYVPHIAISTGLDAVECALQDMGVDTAEFTDSTQDGRIHLYQGSTAYGATAPGTTTQPATSLWNAQSTINQYDMVIDACQGAAPTDKPQAAIDNIQTFAAQGGRVMLEHYEDYVIWPTTGTSAWSSTGVEDTQALTTVAATDIAIDLGFPKGNAFAQWAMKVGASTQLGLIASLTNAREDVLSVSSPARSWMTGPVSGGVGADGGALDNVYEYSFYAGSAACGKVAYSDFHVSAGTLSASTFPSECAGAQMDPVEEALWEFLLLDALSCTQDDSLPPQVPPTH